jgi:hypothetical protein
VKHKWLIMAKLYVLNLAKIKCCTEFLPMFLTCNYTKFCTFNYNGSSVIIVYLITLSVTDYIAVKDWMRVKNDSEMKWSLPNLRYYLSICLQGLRKDTWKPCHNSLCPRWDSNQPPTKHKLEALPTWGTLLSVITVKLEN